MQMQRYLTSLAGGNSTAASKLMFMLTFSVLMFSVYFRADKGKVLKHYKKRTPLSMLIRHSIAPLTDPCTSLQYVDKGKA